MAGLGIGDPREHLRPDLGQERRQGRPSRQGPRRAVAEGRGQGRARASGSTRRASRGHSARSPARGSRPRPGSLAALTQIPLRFADSTTSRLTSGVAAANARLIPSRCSGRNHSGRCSTPGTATSGLGSTPTTCTRPRPAPKPSAFRPYRARRRARDGRGGRARSGSRAWSDAPGWIKCGRWWIVGRSGTAGDLHSTEPLTMLSLPLTRRDFSRLALGAGAWAAVGRAAPSDAYHFDRTISREVLENYLARSISMEGLLNGRGDLDDNIRMLKHTGAKFIGRSLCLWAGEANLLRNLERAKAAAPEGPRGRPGDDPPGLHLRDRDLAGRSGPRAGLGVRRAGTAGGEAELPLRRHALSRRQAQGSLGPEFLGPGREPAGDEALVLLPGGVVHRPGHRGDPLRPGRS